MGEDLPVISMWQPYASMLFAWDRERGEMAKAFETRSFKLPERLVGQPVAIHATQRFAPDAAITPALNDLCYDIFGCGYNYSLPRGAIIGIATFNRSIPTHVLREHQPTTEIAAGDWSDNRWAWPVLLAELLADLVPAKGRQGWWRYPAAALRARSTQPALEGQS